MSIPQSAPLYQREISDLVRAEHVLLWSLRLWRTHEEDDIKVAALLGRAIGSSGLEDGLKAIDAMRDSLIAQPPMIGTRDVSAEEEKVLVHCWAVQAGHSDIGIATATQIFRGGHRNRGRSAAGMLGYLLAENGHALPCPAAFEARVLRLDARVAFECEMARLTSGERLVLTAARVWAAAARDQGCGLTQAAAVMRRHGVPPMAAASLNHALVLLMGSASRTFGMAHPASPHLSPDEGLLIASISAGTRQASVLDMLSPAVQASIAHPLRGLHRHLSRAGLNFPAAREPLRRIELEPWQAWLAAE